MKWGRQPLDTAYRRSQARTSSPVEPGSVARGLTLALLASGEDAAERQRTGQLLVDDLCATARIERCQLIVADRRQVHQHDGQRLRSRTYGYYRCTVRNGHVEGARIRIYHRTAVRQQVVAPGVFLNTLLHEWVHHHDFAGLGLSRSPHTAGFFARLRALADALAVGFVLPPPSPPGKSPRDGAA